MNALAAPCLEARVSAELRELLAEFRWQRKVSPSPPEPAPGSLDHAETVCGKPTDAPAQDPWTMLSLRRDGARPARFRGALVLELRSGTPPAEGHLRLFATAEGEAVAHLYYLPPDTLPARPIFRAAPVATAEALHRFISETAPEQCFAVNGSATPLCMHREVCDMLRLPADLPGLAVPDRPSPVSSEGTPR